MKFYKVVGDDEEQSCQEGCHFQRGIERTEQSTLSADGLVICGKRGT